MVQLGSGSWLSENGLWETPVGRVVALVYIGRMAVMSTFLVARVPREDRVLREEFKEQWKEWSKQTPYRLVPLVY